MSEIRVNTSQYVVPASCLVGVFGAVGITATPMFFHEALQTVSDVMVVRYGALARISGIGGTMCLLAGIYGAAKGNEEFVIDTDQKILGYEGKEDLQSYQRIRHINSRKNFGPLGDVIVHYDNSDGEHEFRTLQMLYKYRAIAKSLEDQLL
jgi:hypothetical protein